MGHTASGGKAKQMGNLERFPQRSKRTSCPKKLHIYFSQSSKPQRTASRVEPTIPRLELCTAVLAVEMADLIQDELDLQLDAVQFYTDSKLVLGYICSESKRFYTYVHNRVQRICQSSKPVQWHYVRTEENPADHASRSLTPSQLEKTTWFTGPPSINSWGKAKNVIFNETQRAAFEKE